MQAVSQLVDSRFDWAHALHEPGRVPPHGPSVNTLDGLIGSSTSGSTSAAPAASSSASSTSASASQAASTSVTSATPPGAVPVFAVSGCATSQSEVALTLERLRLIDGVTSVSLQSSTASSTGASSGSGAGCPQNDPAFALTISFDPLPASVSAADEVPALVYQIAQASHRRDVNFASIVAGTGSASSSPSASAASAASATTAAGSSTAAAGFQQLPFTFTFEGTFTDLYRLFVQLNRATVRTSGGLDVSGRLLTIQGAKLTPVTTSASAKPSARLTGTITATAYVLPGGQTLTGGATASSPNGAATPASTPASASSPAAPAVARVTP